MHPCNNYKFQKYTFPKKPKVIGILRFMSHLIRKSMSKPVANAYMWLYTTG